MVKRAQKITLAEMRASGCRAWLCSVLTISAHIPRRLRKSIASSTRSNMRVGGICMSSRSRRELVDVAKTTC